MKDRPPLIAPGYTSATVTDKISAVVLRGTPRWWFAAFGAAFLLVMLLLGTLGYLFLKGVGIYGVNIPVGWGWGHHQFRLVDRDRARRHAHLGDPAAPATDWRNSINRFAEAMTLFAVACASLYPSCISAARG